MSFAVIIAAMTPEEHILESIKDAVQEAILFPEDQDKKDTLEMHMMMFLLKKKTGGTLEGAQKLIKEMEAQEKKLSVFTTLEN